MIQELRVRVRLTADLQSVWIEHLFWNNTSNSNHTRSGIHTYYKRYDYDNNNPSLACRIMFISLHHFAEYISLLYGQSYATVSYLVYPLIMSRGLAQSFFHLFEFGLVTLQCYLERGVAVVILDIPA